MAKSTAAILHFEGKINLWWRGVVDDEGWTATGEEERCRLLLLMKRKPSAVDDGKERRLLHGAAVDEDWRGSSKLWAVEEIVAAVDEKEVATVSTDDWTLEWKLEWGKRRSEHWTVTVIVAAFMVAGVRLVN